MRVKAQSWIIAALFFAAFSWLGFAAVRFAPIFRGLDEVGLHPSSIQRLFLAYGAVACPLLGIMAAVSVILSDALFRRKWLQAALVAALAVLVASIFGCCLFTHFGMPLTS